MNETSHGDPFAIFCITSIFATPIKALSRSPRNMVILGNAGDSARCVKVASFTLSKCAHRGPSIGVRCTIACWWDKFNREQINQTPPNSRRAAASRVILVVQYPKQGKLGEMNFSEGHILRNHKRRRVAIKIEAKVHLSLRLTRTPVTSGVPQGSVLGHLLSLIYINDLPYSISTSIKLFAGDCGIYREILTSDDSVNLQFGLDNVSSWCSKWLMTLNTSKGTFMRVSPSYS